MSVVNAIYFDILAGQQEPCFNCLLFFHGDSLAKHIIKYEKKNKHLWKRTVRLKHRLIKMYMYVAGASNSTIWAEY